MGLDCKINALNESLSEPTILKGDYVIQIISFVA